MIDVANVRKSFGQRVAVDGVSFTLAAGETLGLLGPNGAGKSTTINMLIGALMPDSGRVSIDGGGSPADSEVRRRIGVAPQSLALYEELTAEENMRFFGRLYGLRGDMLKQRVNWALDFSQLESRRGDLVRTYSGGMKRRLNLAVALIHDPPVVLMDEPTVGVDPQSRNHIFEAIERLQEQGRSVLYTTHYMEEAQRLCDRVAVMDHGKILDIDTVPALLSRHGGKAVVVAELESPPDDTSSLPGKLDGATLRFESDRPIEEVARLTTNGLRFLTLSVEQSNLETVFLTLTGRRLRD